MSYRLNLLFLSSAFKDVATWERRSSAAVAFYDDGTYSATDVALTATGVC